MFANNKMVRIVFRNLQRHFLELFNSPFGALIALGSGLIGQLLLENNFIFWAIILYGLALIGFIYSTRNVKLPEIQIKLDNNFQNGAYRRLGFISGGLAIIFGIISFLRFDKDLPVIAPWLLYLISIGLLFFSAYLLDRGKTRINQDHKSFLNAEFLLLLGILLLAFFLRIYRLDQIPFGLWYDEADNGISALKIINEPGYYPIFAETTNLPAHFIFLNALSLKIFGASKFALRLISVFFGVATVGAGYFASRQFLGQRTAIVFAFLLSVSRWDINWSRIAMHGVTVPFFELLSIGFLFLALKRNKLLDFTFAGLSIGLGLGFYVPLRIFPVVIFLILLIILIKQKNNFKSFKFGLSAIILGVVLASIPVTKYALNNTEIFFTRTRTTSIFNSKTPEEAWKAVAQTTKEHLLMFNFQGDRNGRHNVPGEPMLDPISGTLMVMGIAFSLKRIRKLIPILLIGWLLIMLTPGIFSLDFESPQSLRAIGSLPAAYLLAAVAVVAVIKKGEEGYPLQQRQILNVVLLIALGTAGIINYLIYFDRQAWSFDSWAQFSTRETIIGNKMLELDSDSEYFISTFFYNSPTIKFLAPNTGLLHELQTYESLPFQFESDKRVVIFIDDGRKMLYEQAKRYFPDGDFEEIRSPDGKIILYQAVLNPQDIQRIQGLNARYFKDADFTQEPVISRKETNFSFGFEDHVPLSIPYAVELTGVLNAHSYGEYRFRMNSPGQVELLIDGVTLQIDEVNGSTNEISLAKGNHAITMRATATEGEFEFLWKQPDKEWSIVSANSLYIDPVTNNGLLGQYYANENWQDSPVYTQIDPWIYLYYHNLIIPRPYTAKWTGRILIPEDGVYAFGLESVDESSIEIDDQPILPFKTREGYEEGTIELDSGYHTIEVLFSDHTGYSFINLFWTPPDSKREIIPQEFLFIPDN